VFTSAKIIGISIVLLGGVAGAILIVVYSDHSSESPPASMSSVPPSPIGTVHTADWYIAHPAELKADDARCGSDAASIPQTACQNAATADQRLLAAQLGQAAAINASADKNAAAKGP
jgi:hypothetical protein